jgi:hypothetical protein
VVSGGPRTPTPGGRGPGGMGRRGRSPAPRRRCRRSRRELRVLYRILYSKQVLSSICNYQCGRRSRVVIRPAPTNRQDRARPARPWTAGRAQSAPISVQCDSHSDRRSQRRRGARTARRRQTLYLFVRSYLDQCFVATRRRSRKKL